jgi:hypothetical protein
VPLESSRRLVEPPSMRSISETPASQCGSESHTPVSVSVHRARTHTNTHKGGQRVASGRILLIHEVNK